MALLVGLLSISYTQETISPEDAAKFISESKTVCGTLASAHFAAQVKRQPTFINLESRQTLSEPDFHGVDLGIGQRQV